MSSSEPKRLQVVGARGLALGESRVFGYEHRGEQLQGFLLAHESGLFAYVNRCPHWAVDLDLGDERFYAEDVDRIYCKNHGALFRVQDGMCDHGPCLGRALDAFVVEVEGDDAWLTLSEAP